MDEVPALVRVLAGNPVTSTTVFACLNTADATPLRRLHAAVAGAAAAIPWRDTDTAAVDAVRWRAAFPAAVGVRVSPQPAVSELTLPAALATLAGVTHLDLRGCRFVTDELLLHLPASLNTLYVCGCEGVTADASFTHLTALEMLRCDIMIERLPPSLQVLALTPGTGTGEMWSTVSLAHLPRLRVLHADGRTLDAATLASLPPSLLELDAAHCVSCYESLSFAHLAALRTLDISHTAIKDGALKTLPPSLVVLNARLCESLTPLAMLPHLPSLRLVDVSCTDAGDLLVASLPEGLEELRVVSCRFLLPDATWDHLPALRMLHCFDTNLTPAMRAACRARGCAVPAAGVLRSGERKQMLPMAVFADGRLAVGDEDGVVRVWRVAEDSEVVAELRAGVWAYTLAVLPDGCRLAVGTGTNSPSSGFVEVWDVHATPPVRRATVDCCSGVHKLAVLRDGRLAAACEDGKVRVVDCDAGVVAAVLEVHGGVLAVLPDGTLVSGSGDHTVRVWDVSARACVATLAGHTSLVTCLAVLSDGRLASGARDGTVRLWDVGTRTCVSVLTGHKGNVKVLAALPDGRLASGTEDAQILVWDTRPAAAAHASHAASTVPIVTLGHFFTSYISRLAVLLDGRLAVTIGGRKGEVHLVAVPPPAPYE